MTIVNAPDTTLSEAMETRLQTRSGVDLLLRPVADTDIDIVDRFFDGLTADDMQFRFLSGQSHLSSAQLAAMIGVDHRHREHLLAFDAATSALVASVLIAADDPFVVAEVAISVAPAYKTRGVGWTLLNHAVDLARAHLLTRSGRDALRALIKAEQIAAEELAESPRVAELIDDIEALNRRPRLPGLRELRQRLYG